MPNPVFEAVETAEKAINAADRVSSWTPQRGIMFAFVLMLTGGLATFGWTQWSMEQAAIRARADALEDKSQLVRFMQSEFDKNREERERDRREREKIIAALNKVESVSARLEASTDSLTKALKAKTNTGGIME